MYTLPNKLKVFALVFMVLGALGIIAGFLSVPKTTEDVAAMMADAHHGQGHAAEGHEMSNHEETHEGEMHMAEGHHAEEAGHDMAHATADPHQEHLEHVMHQIQNRPWSALYIASFFFFMIALGALAFYAIQYAAQAGWSPILFRVMEGVTGYLPVASVGVLVLLQIGRAHV